MTTFEEMEAAWKTQSAKLDQATLLLKDRVRQESILRIKSPMRGLIVSLWMEIALCLVGMIVMGGFLAEHITQARYVWPASLMDFWFCGTLIASIRQLLAVRGVSYDAPIAGAQEHLTRLRIMRLETFRWIFLTGQVVWWMPFLITSGLMFFGVDVYRYLTPGFIWTNVLVGLALIPSLLLVSKRVQFAARESWYGRLADVIAGQSLTDAQRQAKALADFVQ